MESKKKADVSAILVGGYILLLFFAFVFYIIMYKETPFAGVFIVVLTMPWSIFMGPLLRNIGIFESVKSWDLFIYAILNLIILYYIGTCVKHKKQNIKK